MFMRISKTAFVLLAALALVAGPAAASLQDGIDLYAAGDPAGATAAWEQGADAGDMTAAYLAAKMYEGGKGVATNPRKAARYLTMAAEGGHIQAQVELGDYYRYGVDEADIDKSAAAALSWYEKAALKQHAEAQMKIGEMHFFGEGAERNRFEGIRWYELAAEKYYTPALIVLSGIYWDGEPLPQDKAKAYGFLLLAQQGSTEESRPAVNELLNKRERQMSAAQRDAGVRIAEAFRLEHPKK
jgi:TPR repeat protein